ncbi:PilZ domain-containing protein [Citrobacter farmeri]|uniref:flagellar brake protein n=1 Tax=Citrobacter farmeri TaxID=67824 RepID=UPI00190363B0|nr:PilZ domain-containing protein [Citrobacter farmeri]EKV7299818.1 PilZ domain-containing protein [Citrobacter farmeri]MBJ8743077.1 PilZ domain-containing protein [Citrobacter farmeri]MBJ8757233.1 PilZ domain-containing protein [Citrobacter farmeri]MBJ9018654.1 PilZ domain-containing protein [Citrobacter farmeri]
MGFGMAKNNKFEIVAIIREALLRKTKVELRFKETSLVTQLEKVDFDYFVIAYNSEIPLSSIQSFILHSNSGIIRFNARFSQSLTDKLGCGLAYRIPEIVLLVQRRQHERFSFLQGYHFYCSGRYKNGENYSLQIKNISRGGCALISQKVNARFLYKNALIKAASLDFEQFGYLQCDLRVVNVVAVNEFDENNQLYSCQQISCKFEFKHPREALDVEKIIIHFLMNNKLKSL